MVKKKIQVLQQQLDEAEGRELNVQKEFETERGLREVVRKLLFIYLAVVVFFSFFF